MQPRSDSVLTCPNFSFSSGSRLDPLRLAYWTCGSLNAARDNAVLLCPGASGDRDWPLAHCEPGRAFTPQRWFVISMDPPGGGGSSRLSTTPAFPGAYSIGDLTNSVTALLDGLGITTLRAFCGSSMGSLVGLDLAARHPHRVRGLALWAAGYRCDAYAATLVDALRASLALNPSVAGMRAAALAWLPSLIDRALLASLPRAARVSMVERVAEEWAAKWRADELVARYEALSACDLAALHGGLPRLAESIACPVIFLSAAGDRILPVHDVEALAGAMAQAQVRIVASPYGHVATARPPGSREFEFFDGATADFLTALA